MKKLKASSQYKKDYKRFRNNPKKVMELKEILNRLANEEPIPEKHNPHMLTGDYKGYMECHIPCASWLPLGAIRIIRL